MRMPTHFLCHGGGPWPRMQDPLRVTAQWPIRPSAILVISARWEEQALTVTSAARGYDHGRNVPDGSIRRPASTVTG
ncbi:hypothetical protein A6A40_17720 (plasmid) [Azospirillum humicireducens]|uniref:Uncharacterized protein n=1 Tax=Azospirillum humicireducens TaxID=1226968 RepID=A0A2R4VR37_9PROT|nr:hypothetical protein A6A40_17720 [Azospirillum humicireducens]